MALLEAREHTLAIALARGTSTRRAAAAGASRTYRGLSVSGSSPDIPTKQVTHP